ncbi:MAG: exo-alpha-sialidase [Acidobacteria bacterium]|nr:exo-alpha-sialidase [Acidobacteriota bacterium]
MSFDFLRISAPRLSSCLVAAAVLVVLLTANQPGSVSGPEPGEGKDRRGSSGRSYAAETVIERLPSASLESAGFDFERVWSGYDDWEPALAADPGSSYVYQMTTRYNGPAACNGCPFPVIVFRSSSDGGATWSGDKFLAVTKKKQNDPEIEVASDGTIFAAWMDDYTPGVKFTKSTNRGASWSTPIGFTGKGKKPNWSDKPILAISRDGRDVYVAFNASNSYVVSSHDYGQTFSKPVKTNSDSRYWFHTGGVVSGGSVHFAAVDFSQDYTGDSHINVQKSSNGGLTWTTTRVDSSREMPACDWALGCELGFFGPSAAITADAAGKLMIAYNAGSVAGAPQKLYARTSTNGVSWSARSEVSNGSSTVNNGFPALAAGPTANDFRLAWQDDRNGSTTAWNAWYRRSTDGGSTWGAAVRLSDLGSGAPYKSSSGHKFPYGDYFEIATDSGGRNHVIWGEGDSFTGPGGSWYTRGRY